VEPALEMGKRIILWPFVLQGYTVTPLPQETFMSENEPKKTAAKAAAKKGFYIVTPERKGAGPPKEGVYTESQRSYYARKYMEIHSAQAASEKDD